MAVSMIGPKFYAWDRNGKPLAFGKLYTYQARTNTPKPTYQSEDQVVENANPVILSGEGYANVYLDGSYKMVLKDKDENEIWSSDPVSSAQAEEWVNCVSASYLSPTSFKLSGNLTGIYTKERKVRLDSNDPEYSYSSVLSSSYAGGETVVTVLDAVVKTGIIKACSSIVGPQSSFSNSDGDNRYYPAFKNDEHGSAIDNMIVGRIDGNVSVVHRLGAVYSTGNTIWKLITETPVDEFSFVNLNELHVDDFGAMPDYIYNSTTYSGIGTDSHAAIQRAIDYARYSDKAGTINFSSGNYMISEKLVFADKSTGSTAPALRGMGRYRSYGETVIYMDSVTPKYMLERPQHIEGIWLSGVQNRLHTGIMGGGYRSTFNHMRFLNFDIGCHLYGVFVDFFNTNFNTCNFGVRSLYLDNSEFLTSTMFGFHQSNFLGCDVGFTSVDQYPDDSGEDIVPADLTVTSNGLRNVKFDGVGFEQCRIGLTSNNRIWNMTLMNCWTEANSEYGIYLADDTGGGSTSLILINCNEEESSPDKWVYPKNSQFGGGSNFAGNLIDCTRIQKEFKGEISPEPVTAKVVVRVHNGDLTVIEGNDLIQSFTKSPSNNIWTVVFKGSSIRYGHLTVGSIQWGVALIPVVRTKHNDQATLQDFGSVTSYDLSFIPSDTLDPTDLRNPAFITMSLEVDYTRART